MDIEALNAILKKFVTRTGGVKDAVLVSNEAELITQPMGEWEQESITGMAAQMLYLKDRTKEHLGWPLLEQMWLQAEENYFIGSRCDNEVFLLVKAINAGPLGGLRITINRTLKALKTALDSEVVLDSEEMSQDSCNGGSPNEEAMWRGRRYNPNKSTE